VLCLQNQPVSVFANNHLRHTLQDGVFLKIFHKQRVIPHQQQGTAMANPLLFLSAALFG
jgi:hypothetical protein